MPPIGRLLSQVDTESASYFKKRVNRINNLGFS